MYFRYDIQFFGIPRTIAHQAPVSMKFSRQEYWSGSPFPSPENPLNPGIKPGSLALQADSLLSEPPGEPVNNDSLEENSKALSDQLCLVCLTEQSDSEMEA